MKNKKLTYLLGFIVVAVWGMIIYRIIYAVKNTDDSDVPAIAAKAIKEPYNDFAIPKDTTRLLLNYRDPFGLLKFKDTVTLPVNLVHHKIISLPVKPGINWGFIKYLGYIRNPGSRKEIALVSINGKNEMFLQGEIKDKVRLIKNLRDSIKVSFNGQTKFISMKPTSP